MTERPLCMCMAPVLRLHLLTRKQASIISTTYISEAGHAERD